MKNISRLALIAWAHSTVFPLFFHATISGCNRRGFSTNLMEINGSDKKFSVCLKRWMKQAVEAGIAILKATTRWR